VRACGTQAPSLRRPADRGIAPGSAEHAALKCCPLSVGGSAKSAEMRVKGEGGRESTTRHSYQRCQSIRGAVASDEGENKSRQRQAFKC